MAKPAFHKRCLPIFKDVLRVERKYTGRGSVEFHKGIARSYNIAGLCMICGRRLPQKPTFL